MHQDEIRDASGITTTQSIIVVTATTTTTASPIIKHNLENMISGYQKVSIDDTNR